MEKEKADRLITAYLSKIYGFAFQKAFSYDEAEELACELSAGVYRSLRKAEEVGNTDGYIFRVCENLFARYVSRRKKRAEVSQDALKDIPVYAPLERLEGEEELLRLRREIARLSEVRREIVFSFYYRNESIRSLARRFHMADGTVKWHLNRARKELKEGLKMERTIGHLGLSPIKARNIGHYGYPGRNGGPEYYLADRLSLNAVYSVYFSPKNESEICDELGITPVFLEERLRTLEENGFLIRQKDGRFTTRVKFSPLSYAHSAWDCQLKRLQKLASLLAEEYFPAIRRACRDTESVFVPGGNRELLEGAMLFSAIRYFLTVEIDPEKDPKLAGYFIQTTDGGRYIAIVDPVSTCEDPDYEMTVRGDFSACGDMWIHSAKYPAVSAWAVDSRFDARKGGWQNNLTSDYESLYELISGQLDRRRADSEKRARLTERGFIDEDGRVGILVWKGDPDSFFRRLPAPSQRIRDAVAAVMMENAQMEAKQYPPQMQDLIVAWSGAVETCTVAMMTEDLLLGKGAFHPLTEREKIAANLLMFSDLLPEG